MARTRHPNFVLYSRWRELTPIQRHICVTTWNACGVYQVRESFWRRLFK